MKGLPVQTLYISSIELTPKDCLFKKIILYLSNSIKPKISSIEFNKTSRYKKIVHLNTLIDFVYLTPLKIEFFIKCIKQI